MKSPFLLGLRAWLALAVSLFILNASLTFQNVWPTPRITWGDTLSIELALCVLLLAIAASAGPGLRGTPHGRAQWLARRVLPVIWIVLVAGRYLAVTAPGLYGREFNLYWDSQHLGNVAAMMSRVAPWWLMATVASVLVLGIALAHLLSRLAFIQVAGAVQHLRARRALAAAATIVLALFAVQKATEEENDYREVVFADPVAPAYVRQARFVASMMNPGAPALGASPAFDSGLQALGGDDVLLVFAESYGAIAFETPAIAGGLGASRAALDAAIRDTGRQVVSAYVDSPTFGGGSWLAHLTLLTGVDIRDQYAYTSVMASSRDTLLGNFERRGYRSVALMPGMRQAWPEGAFYGFDVIYGRDDLEYKGPQFGWWSIPDQYALAKLDDLEFGPRPRAPRLVVFPTSTTHAPFGPIAPYQGDWSRLLTEQPFDPVEAKLALAAMPDLTNMGPSFVRAMAYEYTSFAGYLRHHEHDGFVMVIVGDHQPPAAVSGRNAPWHVPVHVITSRQGIADRLMDVGFTPGLEPQRPPIAPMHGLTTLLLDAFDAPAGRHDPVRLASRDAEHPPQTTTPAR